VAGQKVCPSMLIFSARTRMSFGVGFISSTKPPIRLFIVIISGLMAFYRTSLGKRHLNFFHNFNSFWDFYFPVGANQKNNCKMRGAI
jgi:hypothetical protein